MSQGIRGASRKPLEHPLEHNSAVTLTLGLKDPVSDFSSASAEVQEDKIVLLIKHEVYVHLFAAAVGNSYILLEIG